MTGGEGGSEWAHPWRWAAASVIGTSHVSRGLPCQDNHACAVFHDTRGAPVLAALVCDGMGSSEISQTGPEIACAVLPGKVKDFLDAGGLVQDINRDEVRTWIRATRAALTERAEADGVPVHAYACTLVAAIVSTDAAAFFQLGDGAIVAADGNGGWRWIFWPQRGEYANTTAFVTGLTAEEDFAFSLLPEAIGEVALFSDGLERLVLNYAAQTVHVPFFEAMFPPVRQGPASREALSAALAAYLGSPLINERTDDDKTLILAARLPHTQELGGMAAGQVPAAQASGTAGSTAAAERDEMAKDVQSTQMVAADPLTIVAEEAVREDSGENAAGAERAVTPIGGQESPATAGPAPAQP